MKKYDIIDIICTSLIIIVALHLSIYLLVICIYSSVNYLIQKCCPFSYWLVVFTWWARSLKIYFISINVYLIYFGLKLLLDLHTFFSVCHLSFLYVWCFLFQGFNLIVIVLIIEISFLFSDCFFSWHSVLVLWVKSLLKYF